MILNGKTYIEAIKENSLILIYYKPKPSKISVQGNFTHKMLDERLLFQPFAV
jgi:hypothetical protein